MSTITNIRFADIAIGASATLTRTLARHDLDLFALLSGDANPTHVDPVYAAASPFHHLVAPSVWGGALISALLGSELPGPGTVLLRQQFDFTAPIALGDAVTARVTVRAKDAASGQVTFDCAIVNQHGDTVLRGWAEVSAPAAQSTTERVALPELILRAPQRRYGQLIARTLGMAPLRTAVIHPVDVNALSGAVEAVKAGLIAAVLVGPRAQIAAAALAAGLDLAGCVIVDADDSAAAARIGASLAGAGQVEALMKGTLHTDVLMRAVLAPEARLRTARRMSHVFAIDAPAYPRPLFITDAALNLYPTLADKRDIVQNAIDLAHALGIARPRVALLSAVETVNPDIRSTLDAAALCKMADRGQIAGAVLDGPLAFDNAVSFEAAATKGIVSPVAGMADILLVPDVEAGNMLAKQLEYLGGAQMAGIVLGARVPIILTSRADKTMARLASCAIALLLARHHAGAEAT
jgi:phosphotransacetylase/acyl dehydratase